MRIGHGFDVHKFGGNKPLIIAGVEIPHPVGFIAHSDGDVAIHALCDAILGALAKGDIGHHFPDTDARFKNISSRILLQQVVALMLNDGYQIANVDLTIIAQQPKMAPHIQVMKSTLATDLNTELGHVNVKATTTEGLGYTGRKEGVAVHAVVLLTAKQNT